MEYISNIVVNGVALHFNALCIVKGSVIINTKDNVIRVSVCVCACGDKHIISRMKDKLGFWLYTPTLYGIPWLIN